MDDVSIRSVEPHTPRLLTVQPSVESTLVIIAASIPLLRPIFKRKSGRSTSYEMGSQATRGYPLSSGNGPRVGEINTSSEENILALQKAKTKDGIVKKVDYVVTYDEEANRHSTDPDWQV